jgi:hypothetical protein
MVSEGEKSAIQTVLKHNDELKLIYNYDNYIGFVKENESVINYIHHCVIKVEKKMFIFYSDGEKKR